MQTELDACPKALLMENDPNARPGRVPPAQLAGIEARLIGHSPQIQKIRRLVLDVANADVDVLLVGETGTGKELVARCLHDFGRGAAKNFVALNCGSLPDALLSSELFGHEAGAFAGARKRRVGKIEHADQGTLFLDEIEAMPINLQMTLLRVLQERTIERLGSNKTVPVRMRVVASSTADLKAQVARDQFRSDLYYRLNVVNIELPPLRARREDIPALYGHFLSMAAKRYGSPAHTASPDELRQLMAHDWLGNIRELRNHADCRALGIVQDAGAEAAPQAASRLSEVVETFERALIAAELERQSGNVARSSEALGIARTTLHDKMRKYGLS